MNEILNDQYHNTFFNKDCPLGTNNRCLSEGLVEAAWHLPSSKSNILKNVTMFLNLRGDGRIHSDQMKMLQAISTVIVVMIDVDILDSEVFTEFLQKCFYCLHGFGGIVIAIDGKTANRQMIKSKLERHFGATGNVHKRVKISILKLNNTDRSIAQVKTELRNSFSTLLQDISTESLSQRLKRCQITIDEEANCYRRAKTEVQKMLDKIQKKSKNKKEQILPLQGNPWQSWSKKQKSVFKSSHYKNLQEIGQIKQEMANERAKQVKMCENLGRVMKVFLDTTKNFLDNETDCIVFVLWLKLCLDDMSREDLPEYLSKYQSDWQALKVAKSRNDIETVKTFREAINHSEYALAEASFGFEHLCRETGQIYEALTECQDKSEHMESLTNTLTALSAKCLLMGFPFEIMDGDANSVPIIWVKAVLGKLQEYIGDKRLLALSVLGIQSSGKSTLLNTMFGLQFAVSAGRCTRGIYIQLVPVADKNLKFDYILVIDTEGLRAPELAHQKYSHDNELATFVIGLGDITIINVKGENAAEMKDVLQIAVHAFLRLKLANVRLNLKQSCIFVHQNVPASDANDKMMQGRQKFVENLDSMAEEAADQENIADIHSFSQVIDFDSEKNVWYFSDLWHGDPPMAPVNPGYSESVRKIKEEIFFRLSTMRNTYLSISETVSRIDDLWTGILKDDFVFSFRNSLELKAYNCMERECQTITWGLEKFVLEFIKSDAKNRLFNCELEELDAAVIALTIQLSTKMIERVNSTCKFLDSYVEKNSLKDIMEQWIQYKHNRFKFLGETLQMKAKTQMINIKEEVRIRKLHLSEKTAHETEINKLALELAVSMRGQFPDEEVLKIKFDRLWLPWINKFEAKEIKDVPIKDQIETVICENFQNISAYMKNIKHDCSHAFYLSMTRLEGTLSSKMIPNEYISWRKILDRIGLIKDKTAKLEKYKRQTIDITDTIFRKIDTKLLQLQDQDTKVDISYVTELLTIVSNSINEHNKHETNSYNFNLLPNFTAMLVTHVVSYVTIVFTRLIDKYNKQHSPKAQMEKYKGTAWSLFKNIVQRSTEEVIAVGFFREAVLRTVKDYIGDCLPIDAQENIQTKFANGKYSLIKKILIELADKGHFIMYKQFIQDPYSFAERWIVELLKAELFAKRDSEISTYAKLAKFRIDDIFGKLYGCVSKAFDECKTTKCINISLWINAFVKYNAETNQLPLSADSLIHVKKQKVLDFSNFEVILLDSLNDIANELFIEFQETNASSVQWRVNPIICIMTKLWGCTEICMFCKEPCMNTDKDHIQQNHPHQCLQHRPEGIGGYHWVKTSKLCVEFCNHCVGSELTYLWGKTGEKVTRKYKEYKKHFPDWDIPPNSDVSKYWMWVMCQFKDDLAHMYDVKLPDIPQNWNSISKEQAKGSLSE